LRRDVKALRGLAIWSFAAAEAVSDGPDWGALLSGTPSKAISVAKAGETKLVVERQANSTKVGVIGVRIGPSEKQVIGTIFFLHRILRIRRWTLESKSNSHLYEERRMTWQNPHFIFDLF